MSSKKYFSVKRIIAAAITIPLMVGLEIGLSIGKGILYDYEDTIDAYLCPPIAIGLIANDDEGVDEGLELSKEVVREGSVLVKNDGVLPLSRSNKNVAVLGHGAVDWVVGGSGSGQVRLENGKDRIMLLKALRDYGINYASNVIDYYQTLPTTPIRYGNEGGIVYSLQDTFVDDYFWLYEPSVSDYQAILNSAKSYSDTAIIVLSRRAGETVDPPKHQNKFIQHVTDNSRHYLEISTEEEELLTFAGANFDKTIVLINSTNAMELDFLDTIPGLDACLIVGGTGNRGAAEIPYILYGESNPSGRTVDTYPYDFSFNVNDGYSGWEGIKHYSNGTDLYPHGVKRNAGMGYYTDSPSYMDYAENIYVGYKWFETADAEGYWNTFSSPYGSGYEGVVQFPFGYGLSYTTFDWELIGTSIPLNRPIVNTDKISLQVQVTNTGTVKGKDVVEIYVEAPYTPGGIEKSSVSLVGAAKTPYIESGESATVTIDINVKDFESYDCYDANNNDFKGYELEAGTYKVKLMTDSHRVKTMTVLGEKDVEGVLNYTVAEDILVDKDEVTLNTVENRFTGEAAEGGISIDGSDSNANIPFIHRNEFSAINLSTFVAPDDREITSNVRVYNTYTQALANAWDAQTVDSVGRAVPTTAPNWGGSPTLLFNKGSANELGLELGNNFNDERWEDVLDGVPFGEALALVNSGSFGSAAMPSVGKPKNSDYDGPSQVRGFNAGDDVGTGFPCATVFAQTFNTDLSYKFGLQYGKEMTAKGVDGAYAFGCNIHRSPFQGRNYEYLSEDGFLTGLMLCGEVRGLYNTGKYSFLKHLVCAESENEREAMYTWLTEQSLREIYLRPFHMVIENEECVGIMSSYNRVGGIWAGGSEHLIDGVLRYEWNFKGGIVTDYADNPIYMNGGQSLRAGSNLGMHTKTTAGGIASPSMSSSPRLQHRMRHAVKQILYMTLHVQYQNKIYNETSEDEIISFPSLQSWSWWRPAVTAIEVVLAGGIVFVLYLVLKPDFGKIFKKKEEKGNETK